MQYFTLAAACNTAETGGEYPQVQKMSPGYDYKAPNSVHALSRLVSKFPEFIPNLDYFIVHHQAKLTDLLSVAPITGGFLVSARFKTILEGFNLVNHKFYPARVFHRKHFHDFFWLQLLSNLTEFVDYVNSVFFVYYNYSHNLGYVPVFSLEDYKTQEAKVKDNNKDKTITIWAEKIRLRSEFDVTLDLFEIGTFDANCYITDRLRNGIRDAGVTGCEILASTIIAI